MDDANRTDYRGTVVGSKTLINQALSVELFKLKGYQCIIFCSVAEILIEPLHPPLVKLQSEE